MDETQELLRALMNAVKELTAGQDGMRHELARFHGEFTAFREETNKALGDLRQELKDGLAHLGERWLEHDRDIYTLKRKQA